MVAWLYRFMNDRYVMRLFSQHQFELAFGAGVMKRGRRRRAF